MIAACAGLGWQPLAASSVTPFWQNLYQANALPFPGFGVSLTRYIDVANASAVEPGGSLTFGYLNASLYSSEINYLDIPAGMESYWVVRMDAIAVNGTNATSWAQGNGQMVAIDTGTTLIGGPRDVVASVYAQVEGAKAATGNYNGASSLFLASSLAGALRPPWTDGACAHARALLPQATTRTRATTTSRSRSPLATSCVTLSLSPSPSPPSR